LKVDTTVATHKQS